MAEYVHPEVLVSTQWVADHVGTDDDTGHGAGLLGLTLRRLR